jgi:PAS domain S-box-containing protein
MKPENDYASQDPELRRRVDARLSRLEPLAAEISRSEALTMIHQLRRRQVELEIQNDELRGSQFHVDESEKALKDTTERLRALFLTSPLAIIALDRDRRVISWNPAAERLFGWSALEILGNPLLPKDENEGTGLQEMLEHSLAGQKVEGAEVRCWRRDGSVVEVRLFTAPLKDSKGEIIASVGVLEDITELKRATARLSRSQAEFEAIFNSISDAVAFVNLQRQVVRINPAFQTLFGYEPEEVIGQSTAIFYAQQRDYEEQGSLHYYPEAQARPAVFELVYRRKDGSTFPAETRGTPVRDTQGNILGYVGVLRDITERKRAEEVLQRSHEVLEQLVAERTSKLRQALEQLQREIEERRQAEEKVKEQSHLLITFFNITLTPLAFLDRAFNLIWVNEAYAKNYQRLATEFSGKNHFELYPHEEHEIIFQEVVRTKQPHHAVGKPFIFPRHPEWSETYWDWILTPILNGDREVDFLVLSLNDVTARFQAQQELTRQNSILTGINRIFREPLTSETGEEIGRVCLKVLEELTESKFSFLSNLDPGNQLDFSAISDQAGSSCRLSSGKFGLGKHREVQRLYRRVIQEGQTLLTNDPVSHPDYRGVPADHPEISAFLGVPLTYAGQVIGQIGLGNKTGGYNQADQETAELLTLAIAEVLMHKRVQDALEISEKKLRSLASRLLKAQEEERKRISSELHDELGHALLTFKVHLMTMGKKFLPEQENLAEDLKAVLDYMDEVIENVRRLYLDLSPGDLEDLGLTAALRVMIDDFIKNNHLDSSVELENIDTLFSQPTQTIIYRIIQEILTNIGKHADPTALTASIRKESTRVFFTFADNGKGFDTDQTVTLKAKGLGLMAMEERVHILGGFLKIDSQKNIGTRITFHIPTEGGKGP